MFSALKVMQNRGKQPRADGHLFDGRTVLGAAWFRWFAIFMVLAVRPVPAQQALQYAGAAGASSPSGPAGDYTFKDGDFKMMIVPSVGLQWNDNVNLSRTNVLDDYIVTPTLGINATYQLTERNVLNLNISVGYSRYLLHPDLSTFVMNSSSGTGLSFVIGVQDFTFNLHDWISYVVDPAQVGTVANTASYGTFENTIGFAVTWDLNQVKLSAGYDHNDTLATSSQFNQVDQSSESVFFRAGLEVHPQVTVGLESTASFTIYSQQGLNNNDAYTIGPYVTFRADQALSITARGGFSSYLFQNTSTNIQTANQYSWYANLNITHQPTDFMSYSLDVGRDLSLGVQSDLVENWYVRPSITWQIIKGWDFTTSGFYEHGDQGVGSTGSLPGATTANGSYDWYGGGLSLQHELTDRLSASLNYRITLRTSSTANDSYTQNLVGIQISYHPK